MKRINQTRLSAVVLLLSFIASSVVTKIITAETSAPEVWNIALHAPGATPLNGNTQLPFEEKEKELEDKTDRDDASRLALENSPCICDLTSGYQAAETPYQTLVLSREQVAPTLFSTPLFILKSSLII